MRHLSLLDDNVSLRSVITEENFPQKPKWHAFPLNEIRTQLSMFTSQVTKFTCQVITNYMNVQLAHPTGSSGRKAVKWMHLSRAVSPTAEAQRPLT